MGALLIGALLATPGFAGMTQVVFFTGFNAGPGPGPGTGMHLLSNRLANAGIPDYLGRVFEWTQHNEALSWVEQHAATRGTLVLVGHSFGGSSALQLAQNYLFPLTVDLTVQIDSVRNLLPGANNNVLPSNVEAGFNYYQISTGFFEPQGEDYVERATNINVEMLFGDTSITHGSIDDDPRVHAHIAQNILVNLNPAPGDFDGDGDVDGRDFLIWQRGESPNGLSAADLAQWQGQYGGGAPASTVAVPEPGGAGLVWVLVGMVAMTGGLRTGRVIGHHDDAPLSALVARAYGSPGRWGRACWVARAAL